MKGNDWDSSSASSLVNHIKTLPDFNIVLKTRKSCSSVSCFVNLLTTCPKSQRKLPQSCCVPDKTDVVLVFFSACRGAPRKASKSIIIDYFCFPRWIIEWKRKFSFLVIDDFGRWREEWKLHELCMIMASASLHTIPNIRVRGRQSGESFLVHL